MEYRVKPALVIIDMQNGFISSGGTYSKLNFDTSNYQRIVLIIKKVYINSRSLNIPIFFSQAIREASGIDMLDKEHGILPENRIEHIKKVPLCVRGSWDSDIICDL